jgi:N-acetyl-gamma-glutamyl-phosphate reductase
VANPGCYVITALLGLLPLSPLLEPGSLVVDGKSGTSGAGRAAKDALHFSHVDGSITAYGAPDHRHTGEIERYLGVHGVDLGADQLHAAPGADAPRTADHRLRGAARRDR